jgi:hypothetical protein
VPAHQGLESRRIAPIDVTLQQISVRERSRTLEQHRPPQPLDDRLE